LQDFGAFGHLDVQQFFLDPHFFKLLVLIPAVDKLLYLLSGLKRVHVDIPSHVEVVVLKVP